jgi:hypothetical protein
LLGMPHCEIRARVVPTVGKRIRRDVQNTHHKRAI